MDRQKTTAKKRRRNQNAEIDELAKLLPIKPLPLSATSFPMEQELSVGSSSSSSSGGGDGGSAAMKANQAVDKISVLRTFLKFQEFLGTSGYFREFCAVTPDWRCGLQLWDQSEMGGVAQL